jgi:hypothetical protein
VATIDEMPLELRSLAHRVPEDVREHCTVLELRVRLEEALDLEARADAAVDESRARNLRLRAQKILQAMSPAAYSAATRLLNEDLTAAHRHGDDPAAVAILAEMRQLERKHVQPPASRYLAAAETVIAQEHQAAVPPAPRGHLWKRRRK